MADIAPIPAAPVVAPPTLPSTPATPPQAAVAPTPAAVVAETPRAAPALAAPAVSSPEKPVEKEAGKPAEAPKELKPEEPAKPAPSLLAEAGKEPEKLGEKPPEKPVEVSIPTLPTFEPYSLPEGVKLGEKEVGEFNAVLGEFETQTKVDHRLTQELGQKLATMYVGEMQRMQKMQRENWEKTNADWVAEIKKDPVLGRNRFDTVMRDAARVRDLFATDRFKQMIDYTGAGNHPGMMDFCYNVAKFLDRHGLLREGTPVPAPSSKAPTKGGSRSRYNGNSTQPGA